MSSTTTSLAAAAVASLVRGGAKKQIPPPSPPPNVYDTFLKLNAPLRFFISGNIGNVIFFYVERLTFHLLSAMNSLPGVMKDYIDSVSFFLAYIIQVIPQHWLHAALVYGLETIDTPQKYFTTLLGCYSAYMASLIGSTLLNAFFVKTLKIAKTLSFILTLSTFAVINYFVIGYIVQCNADTVDDANAPRAVLDARKAAKEAQRAIAEAKRKEQAKAKIVQAKMKERAQQAKLKAKALEEKMKAKAELDKQKKKEQEAKEKERAQARAAREKANALKKKRTQVQEVGNRAAVRARGGAMTPSPLRFQSCLGSNELLLHDFVLSVGRGVEIED